MKIIAQRQVDVLTSRTEETSQKLAAAHSRLWVLHNVNKQMQRRLHAIHTKGEAKSSPNVAHAAAAVSTRPDEIHLSEPNEHVPLKQRSNSSTSNSLVRAYVAEDEDSTADGCDVKFPRQLAESHGFRPRCVPDSHPGTEFHA